MPPTGRSCRYKLRALRAGPCQALVDLLPHWKLPRDVVTWAGRVSFAARAGDAAEVGEHLPGRVHGDGPGLKADHAVCGDVSQLLRAPDGCGGVLAVDAVDGEYRVRFRCELTPALVQRGLQLFDHRSLRSLRQRRRLGAAAAERAPGSRADHTVNGQVAVALELLDRALGHRAEDAIDLVVGQGPAAQAVRRTRLRRP